MSQYHVTYFYLATGMEGRPDIEDYGFVDASTQQEAKEIAARDRWPTSSKQDIDWCIGCLTARLIHP